MIETLHHVRIEGCERFACPMCRATTDYQLETHTACVPAMLGRLNPLDDSREYVRCLTCDTVYRASILEAVGARRPRTQRERLAEAHVEQFGDGRIVAFTPAALAEIRRRLANSGFGPDTAVRVARERSQGAGCAILFDTLEISDQDVMQREAELFIVMDNREVEALRGGLIDYADGQFALSRG